MAMLVYWRGNPLVEGELTHSKHQSTQLVGFPVPFFSLAVSHPGEFVTGLPILDFPFIKVLFCWNQRTNVPAKWSCLKTWDPRAQKCLSIWTVVVLQNTVNWRLNMMRLLGLIEVGNYFGRNTRSVQHILCPEWFSTNIGMISTNFKKLPFLP